MTSIEAIVKLKWDSNKNALWELNYKLLKASIRSYHLPQTLILRLLCGSREPSLSVPPYSIS